MRRFLPLFASIALGSSARADFFNSLFGDDLQQSVTREELEANEAEAVAELREASEAETRGKTGKAIDRYEDLVKDFPLTKTAGLAQFRAAQLREKEGDWNKAFKGYQNFLDTYRGSTKFNEAIEGQFRIAQEAFQGEAQPGFLGFGGIQPSKAVEWFDQIVRNAPQSEIAPQALMAKAEILEERKEFRESLAAYQMVVDRYPNSEEARVAQLKMGNSLMDTTKKEGARNPANLDLARESYEDFLINFPDDERVAEARKQLGELDQAQARKNLQIGDFYRKKGQLRAAAIYYKEVLKNPETTSYQAAKMALEALEAEEPGVSAAPEPRRVASTQVAQRLKDRDDYVGPSSPTRTTAPKPRMRVTEEELDLEPLAEDEAAEEGETPMNNPILPPASE
ncbi:MAG: outer membrane protein assembly factor BamD [Verrucomicrobiota bacterium]